MSSLRRAELGIDDRTAGNGGAALTEFIREARPVRHCEMPAGRGPTGNYLRKIGGFTLFGGSATRNNDVAHTTLGAT